MAKDKYYDETVEVTMPRRLVIKLKHILSKNPNVDVEDVMRCKNCNRCEYIIPEYTTKGEIREAYYCSLYERDTNPDDYCSRGKREEK